MQPLALAHSLTLITDVAAALPSALWLPQDTCSLHSRCCPLSIAGSPISPSFPSNSLAFREVQEGKFCSCLCQTWVTKSDGLWVTCQNFNLVFQSEMSHLDVNHSESFLVPVMNRSWLHQTQRGFADFFFFFPCDGFLPFLESDFQYYST